MPVITRDVSSQQCGVQIQQASTLLIGCPACDHNFKHFFCTLTCHPDQSTFVNITDVQLTADTNVTAVKQVMSYAEWDQSCFDAWSYTILCGCRPLTTLQMLLGPHFTTPARCVAYLADQSL